MKPDPNPRTTAPPNTDESQQFVSTTIIRVQGTKRMGGWAQIYRDVWTSEEFTGRPTVDQHGRNTRTKPLGRAGMAVYVYLATHTSGQAGTCHGEEDVSQARMSAQLGMSPNTVRRGVRELTDRGLLTVRRGVDARGRKIPSYIYQLHDPPSLTNFGEPRVPTHDPSLDPTHDPSLDPTPPPGGSNFGSPPDPNLDPRREKSQKSKNTSSRRGHVDRVTTHQDRAESDNKIRAQLLATRQALVDRHGEAKAEQIIPLRTIGGDIPIRQLCDPLVADESWTHIGNEPNALRGQLAIRPSGDS